MLAAAATLIGSALLAQWNPGSIQDLHREYGNIFRHGNRNAASHLWASFILDRAHDLSADKLEEMFTGFCAVSGSPTRPSDYTRYRLTLPLVAGTGNASGFLYYCCWPCVCDTQDFIRVDTRTITLANGATRVYHWAVIGNPCDNPSMLRKPFVQPFHGRGETTLEREAAEVRCDGNRLIGATLSDHGYPIISMFFDAIVAPSEADGAVARTSTDVLPPPQPGRISHTPEGVAFQDEREFGPQCADRAANGYNSGMGEIFRRAASISPIKIAEPRRALSAGASVEAESPPNESCTSSAA